MIVYQESSRFSYEILVCVRNWPPRHNLLADQLRRAVMSIPANIAEGWARWHSKEKKQFYRIAMGSAYECVPHLENAFAENLLSQEELERWVQSLDRISRLLNGLIRSVKE